MAICEAEEKQKDGRFVQCDSRYADDCLIAGQMFAVEVRLCSEHQEAMKADGYKIRRIKRYDYGEKSAQGSLVA